METQMENLNTEQLISEILKESDKIQNLIKSLGIENISEIILNTVFLRKIDSDDSNAIFKHYLCHLSIEDQSMFFNRLFNFSKEHQDINFLCLILEYINMSALTHESSILQTRDFWVFLINFLENCKNSLETKKVIFVLVTCINSLKNAKLELQFLSTANDERAWNAFLALVQVFNYGEKALFKSSVELLQYILPLDFFWQYCVLKLLLKRATDDLKCIIITFFLKQSIDANYLQDVFEIISPAIHKHECNNEECPAFKELNNLCRTINVEQFTVILDAILKFSWSSDVVEFVVANVLVDSKKNLIDFEYFSRFEALVNTFNQCNGYWPVIAGNAVLKFFGDSENFMNLCQVGRSSFQCYSLSFTNSEDFETKAIRQIIDLSNENSDDINEIRMYFSFLGTTEKYGDMLKNHQLSIHVRLVVYLLLFNIRGYSYAEHELDQGKTISDFHEYLIKHINEKTYLAYKNLMVNFLDLMSRFMEFTYPKDACLEILNIMRNPERYTKYQIYCATEILRVVYYRFDEICIDEQGYYKEIAQKWKYFILETEDDDICKEGLYFVLEKGQLGVEEYNKVVEKLLEKHLCDDITEEIYNKYLDVDSMQFASKRLGDIMEHSPKKYEEFLGLFCKAAFSDKYVNSNHFSYENAEMMFCFSNSKNLLCSIRAIYSTVYDYSEFTECRRKIMDMIIELYLNELSNIEAKVYCLRALRKVVARYSHDPGPPPFYFPKFREDVKMFMNKLKEKYAANLKNDVNKLRIVQALFLLVAYVMRDFDKCKNYIRRVNIHKKLRNSLKRIAVGILVKESSSKNKAVRHICQHMYILLCEHDVTFEEIKCITEKVKKHSDLASSFMPVLYHVIPFCKLSESEVEEIFSTMFFLSQTSDNQVRLCAQILLQRLYHWYNSEQFQNITEKYKSKLEQISLNIERTKEQIAEILDVDYIFLKYLDPVRDYSLETVLYTLPKLNQVDPIEWTNVMTYGMMRYSNKDQFLKESVDQFLGTEEPGDKKYIKYSAEDLLNIFKAPSQNPVFYNTDYFYVTKNK